jgi:hypothetical protein
MNRLLQREPRREVAQERLHARREADAVFQEQPAGLVKRPLVIPMVIASSLALDRGRRFH